MVNLTIEQINSRMNKRENIRNISIISRVDHGKSMIIKNLINNSGINILKFYYEDRKSPPIQTLPQIELYDRSRLVQFNFEKNDNNNNNNNNNNSNYSGNNNNYLINLMETSGKLEQDTIAALRITDGVIVLVDCVEGFTSYPEKILQTAVVNEILKPVLFLNKVDRFFLELKLNPEEMYQSFYKTIESINSRTLSIISSNVTTTTTTTTTTITSTVSTNGDDILLSPIKGNVLFGSGLYGWSFSIEQFAKQYSHKFCIPIDNLKKRLWGDNYFDPIKKKWSSFSVLFDDDNKTRPPLKRGFCQFILEPIEKLTTIIMENNEHALKDILKSLNIQLNDDELALKGKQLLKIVMMKWLPLSDNLFSMCVNQLPSPIDAQKYRVSNLYEGPMNDECADAIRKCDPNGPLMIFISKLVPSPIDNTQFYGIGRIFSGMVGKNQKVKFMIGGEKDITGGIKEIGLITNNGLLEPMDGETIVSCGNIIGFNFIDKYISNSSGTISSPQVNHCIRGMRPSTSPVVKVAIEPVNPVDLPKLVEALRKLKKADVDTIYTVETTGEHIIAGTTESCINSSLNQLSNLYLDNSIKLRVSDLFLSFRESISVESSVNCLAKSPNKLNRIYMSAEPLSTSLQDAIDNGLLSTNCENVNATTTTTIEDQTLLKDEIKYRTNQLVENYGWNQKDAIKIWTFGPDSFPFGLSNNTNCLVDKTLGVQYIKEIKGNFLQSFNWACREGPLCDEPMKGVRFNILDVMMSDAIRRGSNQIIPTCRRALYSSFLTASPTLLEPWYKVEINTVKKESSISEIYSIINQRRGIIYSSDERIITFSGNYTSFNIIAHIPVLEYTNFERELNVNTLGSANLVGCSFDHWSSMGGILNYNITSSIINNNNDNLVNDQKLTEMILEIRKRKGLTIELPQINNYIDRL